MRGHGHARGRRLGCSAGGLLLALTLASCDFSILTRPTLPQVDEAREALRGGGDRYRAHNACVQTAKSVDDLLACMHDAGWDFVTRRPSQPEADCWRARDHGEVDGVLPLCFVSITDHATGSPAPAAK